MVAAAVIGSAVVGAGASMSSASKQSKALKSASSQEVALQREAQANAEKELRPYVVEGDQARRMYNAAFGVAPANDAGGLDRARAEYNSGFEASPFWQDAQYSTAQAMNALRSSNAALGKGSAINSGKALRAASDITQGYRGAATQNYIQGLGGISDTGFTASSGIASAGQNFANQASNAIRAGSGAAANAQAQGTANAAGFLGWGVGQALNAYQQPTSYFTPTVVPQATPLNASALNYGQLATYGGV